MLPNKNTTVLSDIKGFFTSSQKASNTIYDILRSLKISDLQFGLPQDLREIYPKEEIIKLMLIFPLIQVKNAFDYCKSPVYHLFCSGKDVFYRMKNNERIDWRSLGYHLNSKLIRLAEKRGEAKENAPKCLIVDDTDLAKTGYKIELIGRIWSHVSQRSHLGFKGLFMGYHDGKSFYGLDFSLHGEEGKNKKKPFGLAPKELKARYTKKRSKKSSGYQRIQEYYEAKTQTMQNMIRTAIKSGVRFEYLLVDSWFMGESLIRFVLNRKFGCHLLGMAKMGNAKYSYREKDLSAKEIIDDLKRKKKIKKSKLLKVWYSSVHVEYKGIRVQLFFCKNTHHGKWNVLLTTNADIDFEEAYRIYSVRWTIEVFFKESKQYFGLGKSQSQDFDAQISDTTIGMIQYNVLSLAKRFLDYESMGVLFKQAKAENLMLTLAEQIWEYLLEVLEIITEIFDIDMDELLKKLVEENQAIMKLLNLDSLKKAA